MSDHSGETPGPIFSGSFKQQKKDQLIALARDLKLPDDGTKDQLIGRIKVHFEQSPHLYEQPKYEGLALYRKQHAPTGKSNKGGKKSDEKDAEDATESAKVQKEATGAARTLEKLKLTFDPPPRAIPSTGAQPVMDKGINNDPPAIEHDASNPFAPPNRTTESSPEPPGSDDGLNLEGAHSPKKLTASSVLPKSAMKPVVVKIHEYKPTGSYQGPEQIWLLPDGQNFKIIRRSLSDWGGPIEYIVKLSELLPQTVQQNSPMKGGRIFRPSHTDDGGFIPLGSVATILEGRSSQLKLSIVDEYVLECDSIADAFVCNVWCDRSAQTLMPFSNNPTTMPAISTPSVPDAVVPNQPAPPTHIASTSNIPLAPDAPVPNQPAPPTHIASASSTEDDPFIAWLRQNMGGSDHEWKPWPKAKTMRQILERRRALLNCIDDLTNSGWCRSQGGFQVPTQFSAAGKYAGKEFTQNHVGKALYLTNTTINEDRALFKPETLHLYPKVQAWLDDPYGKYDDKFGNMVPKQFKEYLKKSRASLEMKKSEKKRAGDDGDSEAGPSRKLIKKRVKSNTVYSDHLDSN